MRIPYEEALSVLQDLLVRKGFSDEDARISAGLFCDANRDGVESHGLARFGNMLSAVDSGRVIPEARPSLEWSGGSLERWNGNRGPGNLNARHSMARSMELAGEHGIGCVALSETNHWMRGGNYGWQAADAGFMAICWTNTMPNLPPWGSAHALIGNNPLVIAVPRSSGDSVVLDMAMSQFSWGALDRYRQDGRELPVPGGYDSNGVPSTDASAITESGRPLPIGFWKGSGLAIMLDMMAAMLSGGRATCDIESNPASETGISQVFIAFNPPENPGLADRILASLTSEGEEVFHPGRRSLENRRISRKEGIPVDESVWEKISSLSRQQEQR